MAEIYLLLYKNKMPYQITVGLQITDDALYEEYRKAIAPLLKAHGGHFRYDFRIAEVLMNESNKPINRLFVLSFTSKDAKERFFSSSDYKDARENYFQKSVAPDSVCFISERDD